MNADKLTEILRLSEQNTKLIEALQSEAEENNEYIKQLESQLTASQARERAAVEELKTANLCRQCVYDAQCGSENYYRRQKRISGHCDHWEWRGPQRAGEEEK